MQKFISDASRNQNRRTETREYINRFNQDQIVERTGVGNNRTHLCAESCESFQIALKVFIGIFELDAALL